MIHLHIKPQSKKYYIAFVFIFVVLMYLFISYEYFYLKLGAAHIPWPNNQLVYHFNESSGTNIKYVALGDSLTYGFGANEYKDSYTYKLANYLSQNGNSVTLNDLSYPGNRTDDIKKQLNATTVLKPDIITLFIGINDTHQLVETSNFEKNYDQILYQLVHTTNAKIYLINIPYLGPSSINLPPFNFYYEAKTRSHNKTIEKLASKYNLSYIDLYGQSVGLFKNNGPHYAKDQYHPSAEGYEIWSQIIKHAIHQ